MKILEVLDCYYPKFDGPVQVVTNYCKSLNKIEGCSAEVCVPRFPKYTDNQPFPVFRVSSLKGPEGYYYGVPSFDSKLKKYLKENRFDVIHVHSPFTMCGFFADYGKRHKIPVIFTFHTKFREDFERVMKGNKLKINVSMSYIMGNIKKVYKVLSVSDGAGECLNSYGYKKSIDVIRNGTDLVFPENAEELKNIVREKHNLKSDETILLSVGRIVENKKLDFALDVCKILKERNFNFKYIIVGAGPYENSLKAKVSELKLDDVVIFTGKVMDRELLSAYYLASSLFVFPSTFDTASLAPIEASAMKLPTVMTAGCSTAEIICPDEDGLLCKENDADEWAQKIIDASVSGKLGYLSENAFKNVYKTWDEVAKEVYAYYVNTIDEYKKKIEGRKKKTERKMKTERKKK